MQRMEYRDVDNLVFSNAKLVDLIAKLSQKLVLYRRSPTYRFQLARLAVFSRII